MSYLASILHRSLRLRALTSYLASSSHLTVQFLDLTLVLVQCKPSSMQGVKLPDSLRATARLDELVSHASVILMVVPTPFVAATVGGIKDQLQKDQVIINPLLQASFSQCLEFNSIHG